MKKLTDIVKAKPWVGWLLYLVSILIVFLIGVLASTIVERRNEANLILRNVKPLADWEALTKQKIKKSFHYIFIYPIESLFEKTLTGVK